MLVTIIIIIIIIIIMSHSINCYSNVDAKSDQHQYMIKRLGDEK